MQLITLTSDMGWRDYYVSAVKATICRLVTNPVQILDITHEVSPFDVAEAAFHVGQAFGSFPPKTIHIIGVDAEPFVKNSSEDAVPCVMVLDDQYFVANDNGFFSVLERYGQQGQFFRVDAQVWKNSDPLFATKNILVPIACKLANGEKIEDFAHPATATHSAFSSIPTIEEKGIKGIIIHFDAFGNAMTNIHKKLFEEIGQNQPFIIQFRRGDSYKINRISSHYHDVANGEKVALFNENGWLEIAINKGANKSTGGAQTLFGLHKNDLITITFNPQETAISMEELFVE